MDSEHVRYSNLLPSLTFLIFYYRAKQLTLQDKLFHLAEPKSLSGNQSRRNVTEKEGLAG